MRVKFVKAPDIKSDKKVLFMRWCKENWTEVLLYGSMILVTIVWTMLYLQQKPAEPILDEWYNCEMYTWLEKQLCIEEKEFLEKEILNFNQ